RARGRGGGAPRRGTAGQRRGAPAASRRAERGGSARTRRKRRRSWRVHLLFEYEAGSSVPARHSKDLTKTVGEARDEQPAPGREGGGGTHDRAHPGDVDELELAQIQPDVRLGPADRPVQRLP